MVLKLPRKLKGWMAKHETLEKVFVTPFLTPFWKSPFLVSMLFCLGVFFQGMIISSWPWPCGWIWTKFSVRRSSGTGSQGGPTESEAIRQSEVGRIIPRNSPNGGGLVREILLFQGNLGWWPDLCGVLYTMSQGHLVDIKQLKHGMFRKKTTLVIWHVCFQEVDEFEEATESIRFKTSTFNETLR